MHSPDFFVYGSHYPLLHLHHYPPHICACQTMALACVVYSDDAGNETPLSELFCGSAKGRLVSTHPTSSTMEIDGVYCPDCLEVYAVEHLGLCPKCVSCPQCGTTLRAVLLHDGWSYMCAFRITIGVSSFVNIAYRLALLLVFFDGIMPTRTRIDLRSMGTFRAENSFIRGNDRPATSVRFCNYR